MFCSESRLVASNSVLAGNPVPGDLYPPPRGEARVVPPSGPTQKRHAVIRVQPAVITQRSVLLLSGTTCGAARSALTNGSYRRTRVVGTINQEVAQRSQVRRQASESSESFRNGNGAQRRRETVVFERNRRSRSVPAQRGDLKDPLSTRGLATAGTPSSRCVRV